MIRNAPVKRHAERRRKVASQRLDASKCSCFFVPGTTLRACGSWLKEQLHLREVFFDLVKARLCFLFAKAPQIIVRVCAVFFKTVERPGQVYGETVSPYEVQAQSISKTRVRSDRHTLGKEQPLRGGVKSIVGRTNRTGRPFPLQKKERILEPKVRLFHPISRRAQRILPPERAARAAPVSPASNSLSEITKTVFGYR